MEGDLSKNNQVSLGTENKTSENVEYQDLIRYFDDLGLKKINKENFTIDKPLIVVPPEDIFNKEISEGMFLSFAVLTLPKEIEEYNNGEDPPFTLKLSYLSSTTFYFNAAKGTKPADIGISYLRKAVRKMAFNVSHIYEYDASKLDLSKLVKGK